MTSLQMEFELLAKWHALPIDKQQEALDFVKFLDNVKSQTSQPLQSALGLCADLNISICSKEIDAARQESWGKFQREDF